MIKNKQKRNDERQKVTNDKRNIILQKQPQNFKQKIVIIKNEEKLNLSMYVFNDKCNLRKNYKKIFKLSRYTNES